MASATKRDQGKWLGRYRGPDSKEHTKTFATKGAAKAWAEAEEARIRSGAWTDPTGSRVAVAEWSSHWLTTLTIKESTRVGYESLLRNQVVPRWGSVRLDRISPSDVKAWVASMTGLKGQPLSPSRVHQAFHVLSSMLDLAVDDGRLPRNPARPNGRAKGVLPPLTTTKEHTFLSHAQLSRLADAAGSHRGLILLMGYCGLRWGEAVALRVRDVDLLHRRISVKRTAVELHGVVKYGTPKSNKSRTVVPPQSLCSELEPLMLEKATDDLLFTAPGGGPLRMSNFRSRVFDPAAKRAGLRLTPHDLRHTAASLGIASGASVKAVQNMLGHASAALTLNTYAGLFDSDLESVADRMDEAISSARADYLRTAEQVRTLPNSGHDGLHAV